ncbi:hypothetical protein QQF64_027331 [Cirrhinus molitorella]|uniref:PiggyBac transposable element-derived protein domain-containing protein n=1 Tax=Cirrhinus molitorella TaxID=172907 RepID=A0ABR3NC23_9TELE
MTLLAPYLRKGHVLYTDNWYGSPTLFQHLLSLGTGACGTVCSNRKGMPVFTCKMTKGEVDFTENGSQLAVKWHDKRDVHVLTTVHPTGVGATGRLDHITGQLKMKPVCVLEYNKKMGAVDKADMMTVFLEYARKTTKWYKRVLFHLFDTVVLNNQIVYRQLTGKEITSMQTRRHCKVCLSSAHKSKQRHLTKYNIACISVVVSNLPALPRWSPAPPVPLWCSPAPPVPPWWSSARPTSPWLLDPPAPPWSPALSWSPALPAPPWSLAPLQSTGLLPLHRPGTPSLPLSRLC